MNTVALLLLLAGDIETNPGPYKPGMNQYDYLLSRAEKVYVCHCAPCVWFRLTVHSLISITNT